jgi:hypothetical protein
MSLIKILDASLNELATLPYVIDGDRTEEINGENLLSFSLLIDGTIDAYIDETAVIGYGADYFDIAYFEKVENGGRPPEVRVECEHISYRLNNPEYNKEYFTEIGTPVFIFGKILEGTEFSIGTIDFSEPLTYSAQEAKSRRQLLFEFAYLLGGELVFNGFEISIVEQRGSSVPKDLTSGGNVTVLSKRVDKRKRDELGNPTIYYTCSLYNPVELTLGDVVVLEASKLDIDIELRIVKLTVNPYDPTQAVFEISNTLPSLEDSIYRIESSTLAKGKTYYGARISPEHGFESIRSDKMARTVMNADLFAMQAGDGQGNWTNKLYFDPALGKYIFDGMLSATMIEALEAQFDITISNTTITQVLAAETGYIAQLTVDSVETSTKVQKYLAGDKSDVNYIKIFEQYIQFITASTDGTQEEQAKDRYGALLYWTDETHKGTTLDETDYPVMIYVYDELVKAEFAFESDGTNYVPKITLGTGDGVLGQSAQAEIYKSQTGLEINYYRSNTGELRQIKLDDDGVFINGLRYELTALNIASDSFQASYGDVVQNATLIKDVDGNITSIMSGGVTIPISYNEV